MTHRANPRFWRCYDALPDDVQRLADARVGLHWRALAVERGTNLVWFWIGSHAEYDKLVEDAM